MAKKRNKKNRQGLFSKAINIGGILIGLARPIEVLINQGFSVAALQNILRGLSFGLVDGVSSFSFDEGFRMYAPVLGAVGYREFTKYLMRKFPIRG